MVQACAENGVGEEGEDKMLGPTCNMVVSNSENIICEEDTFSA